MAFSFNALLLLTALARVAVSAPIDECALGAASCDPSFDEAFVADEAEVNLVKVQLLQSDVRVHKTVAVAVAVQAAETNKTESAVAQKAEVALDTSDRQQQAKQAQPAKQGPQPASIAPASAPISQVGLNATGLSLNASGDLSAFISGLIVNACMFMFCIGVFMVLRLRYEMVYSNNVLEGIAPEISEADKKSYWGWYRASNKVTLDQAAESIGLDNAMMIEFANLCMRIMMEIGIPMICVIGPLNWIFGGHAAGDDHLSNISFGNVEHGSWLYWVHSAMVYFVVHRVVRNIFHSLNVFKEQREKWLTTLPTKRANTVLVEGIPELVNGQPRSDKAVKEYFTKLFAVRDEDSVDVNITKCTSVLTPLVEDAQATQALLEEAEGKWNAEGRAPEKRPQHRDGLIGGKIDSIQKYTDHMAELKGQIESARSAVLEQAEKAPGDIFLSNGFVTFSQRSYAELAMMIDISGDKDEWTISAPPEPQDLLWADFKQGDNKRTGLTLIGYGLVAGLYCGYLPIVIAITNLANLVNLGPIQPLWASIAPTLGLQFMVAMLPTFLILIFRGFFTLKADAWAQHRLQVWYFWFQVVFVILATAIGQNAVHFATTVLTNPMQIISVLATTMPYATHFFMNFMVLQCVTHAMNLMRYVILFKFKTFSHIYDEKKAKDMAEPEDQDYYGIGSRSARWAITMLVGIIFGTLCPPMCALCYLHFWVVRVIYGYLIPFAETKKADLGGVFFVKMLEHLFIGSVIYCILMIGVFSIRGANFGPMFVSIPPLVYVCVSFHKFKHQHNWETLAYHAVMFGDEKYKGIKSKSLEGVYKQPELADEAY